MNGSCKGLSNSIRPRFPRDVFGFYLIVKTASPTERLRREAILSQPHPVVG